MFRRLARFLPEWITGALCLLIPGLFNRFPLVNGDTGAYIENAYMLYVPLDRPLGYSVFLRLGLMDLSLWIPVLLQALTLSGLMLALTQHFLGTSYTRWRFMLAMLILGIFTSAGWFAAQISPDIFSGILILTALCLALVPMPRIWRWLLYGLVLLTILCHNSNLLLTAGAGVLLLVLSIRRRSLRRIGLELFLPTVVGGLTLCTMNLIAERGFRPSAGSHVFLMSRMVETGLAEEFLQDYCALDTPRYRLCDWQGKLPVHQWDFMWGTESPLYAAGGWLAVEPEYNRIIGRTLRRPKYIGLHLRYATIGTLQQLPLIEIGDGLQRFDPGTSPYDRVSWNLPSQLPAFRASRQFDYKLHLDTWNRILIPAEILLMLAPLLFLRRRTPGSRIFRNALFFTLLLLVINAAMTATFATVVPRYEARVIWILPFLSTLYILRWLHFRSSKNVAQL